MKNLFLLKLLFIIFISFCAIYPVKAQENVRIQGQLVDSLSGNEVSYATVKIIESLNPGNIIKAVAADMDGKFNMSVNKQPHLLLVAEFMGKQTVFLPLEFDEKNVLDFGKISMSDDAGLLNEVVVTAQKPLVKVDLDKITYSMQDDPDARTNNLLEMLKKVPLITVDGNENIQLKGSSNFKIYLNGKPSNMITNNPKDVLKSMPANTIKDIEVITDPGAKYDAEGVAGIINIITYSNSDMGGYTATVNSHVNTDADWGVGGYLALKYGKVGFTGNYNISKWNTWNNKYYSVREDYTDNRNNYLHQWAKSNSKGFNQYGSGELSFEIDTLNLVSFSFNRFYGASKEKSHWHVEMEDINRHPVYLYENTRKSRTPYGGTDFGFDYQRTFSVKDRLFTASYKLSLIPSDSKYESEIYNGLNYHDSKSRQYSDANMNEHTFQLDYTTPIEKRHTVEAGIKYIMRINKSKSGNEVLDSDGSWLFIPSPATDDFRHEQDILGAYAGYSYKMDKIGLKGGLRYEYTNLEAKFPLDEEMDFGTDYSNLVPSATVTYQMDASSNFRLGYNMRIYRPGIWHLNPYVNSVDSNYISMGNPGLDAVKSHSVGLNYSLYKMKFNLNANISYTFQNNGIEQITTVEDGVSYTTYENIGKSKQVSMFVYFNWTPTDKLRVYGNAWLNYMDLKSNDDRGLSRKGINNPGIYAGIQYTLPAEFKLNVNGGYWGGYKSLQSKSSASHFHSVYLNKSFKDDRLTFSAGVSDPFMARKSYESRQEMPDYYFFSSSSNRNRLATLSVSYRFGEMKAQVKKVVRGITNDDVMNSGSGGGQGGGK